MKKLWQSTLRGFSKSGGRSHYHPRDFAPRWVQVPLCLWVDDPVVELLHLPHSGECSNRARTIQCGSLWVHEWTNHGDHRIGKDARISSSSQCISLPYIGIGIKVGVRLPARARTAVKRIWRIIRDGSPIWTSTFWKTYKGPSSWKGGGG